MALDQSHTLAEDGDPFEKAYWAAFAREQFPSYAEVWERAVKPLRAVPTEVQLRKPTTEDPELDKRIVIAQLNYTTLMHLGRVFQIRECRQSFYVAPATTEAELWWKLTHIHSTFAAAIVALSSATDTADELLERMLDGRYDPWSEKASQEARMKWRKDNDPLLSLHRYRNRLVHGPMLPNHWCEVVGTDGPKLTMQFPKLAVGTEYLDWRNLQYEVLPDSDFVLASELVDEVWASVLGYLEERWSGTLLDLIEAST